MARSHTWVAVGTVPTCDLEAKHGKAFADVYIPALRTWGNVCLVCFASHYCRLGQGRGQALVPAGAERETLEAGKAFLSHVPGIHASVLEALDVALAEASGTPQRTAQPMTVGAVLEARAEHHQCPEDAECLDCMVLSMAAEGSGAAQAVMDLPL